MKKDFKKMIFLYFFTNRCQNSFKIGIKHRNKSNLIEYLKKHKPPTSTKTLSAVTF